MHCTTPSKPLYPILMHYWPVSFITYSTSPVRRMANPSFSFPSLPPCVHTSLISHSIPRLHFTPPLFYCNTQMLFAVYHPECTSPVQLHHYYLFKWLWLQIGHIKDTLILRPNCRTNLYTLPLFILNVYVDPVLDLCKKGYCSYLSRN